MKVAFLSLPIIDGNYFIAEDCCGDTVATHILPSLILNCASEAKKYCDAHFIDMSFGKVDLSGFDLIVYCIPWLYHDKIISTIGFKDRSVVISTQPGYTDDIQSSFDIRCVSVERPEQNILKVITGDVHNIEFAASKPDFSLVNSFYWKSYESVLVQITRGCIYNCKFCMWGGANTQRVYNIKRPDVVVKILNEITTVSGRKLTANLLCSQITTSIKWLREFDRLMQTPYPYMTNVNLCELSEEKLKILKRTGCLSVTAGLEGLCDSVLDKIGKPFLLDGLLRGVSLLSDSEISYKLHFRFGFGESESEVNEQKRNLRLLRASAYGKFNGMSIGPMIHYKGTNLYSSAHYDLINHPEYPRLKIQSNIQWGLWSDFVSEAIRLRLIKKYRRYPKQYL